MVVMVTDRCYDNVFNLYFGVIQLSNRKQLRYLLLQFTPASFSFFLWMEVGEGTNEFMYSSVSPRLVKKVIAYNFYKNLRIPKFVVFFCLFIKFCFNLSR